MIEPFRFHGPQHQILTKCLAEGNPDCTWTTMHQNTDVLIKSVVKAVTTYGINLFRKKKYTVDECCYSPITELLSNSLSKHL